MGGLWVDYQRTAAGGLEIGSPRNQQTSIPGVYAIGECDYQYHGANRLGANSLLSCIFSGLIVAPSVADLRSIPAMAGAAAALPALLDRAVARHQADYQGLLARPRDGENPYLLHQQLGRVMTRAATVVRHNDDLDRAYEEVLDPPERAAARSALSDTGQWTNQNLVFTRAMLDMFPLAKTILKGARARDECRGAHFKPEFAMPDITATEPAEQLRQAEAWCDRFGANNRKWLKSTIAVPGRPGRAGVELRGRGHVDDPAPAAALRHGRRQHDRRSLARAPCGQQPSAASRSGYRQSVKPEPQNQRSGIQDINGITKSPIPLRLSMTTTLH